MQELYETDKPISHRSYKDLYDTYLAATQWNDCIYNCGTFESII